MLRIKKSQVLLAMIVAVGGVAFGELMFLWTGIGLVSYLCAILWFAGSAWSVINNQDNWWHENMSGYLNVWFFFLSLILIAFAFHWAVSLGLFVAFIWVGFRVTPYVEEQPEEDFKIF